MDEPVTSGPVNGYGMVVRTSGNLVVMMIRYQNYLKQWYRMRNVIGKRESSCEQALPVARTTVTMICS